MNIQLFGEACPPLYGKTKFYLKKKNKSLKAIEKHTAIIELCDKAIKENEQKKA